MGITLLRSSSVDLVRASRLRGDNCHASTSTCSISSPPSR
ncbi:hypothetical protein NY08_483 [Rhodococcus sp. B7740]|nr:hypothetical protein NY08_483 [Rhodococcus sp. B7740]